MTLIRFERLHAALSSNGHRVHLATADGMPVCGSSVLARCRVHARITCPQCRRRRPKKAQRLDSRPLVTGVDWSPLYAAIRRALEDGATEPPIVKVSFWPMIAE